MSVGGLREPPLAKALLIGGAMLYVAVMLLLRNCWQTEKS